MRTREKIHTILIISTARASCAYAHAREDSVPLVHAKWLTPCDCFLHGAFAFQDSGGSPVARPLLVLNHRGEKVPDFFKFYHGAVKILPRCRKNSTTVP